MENRLIYDNAGIPSIMVPIQKFLLSDVIEGAPPIPHPAFVVKGHEVPEIFISKYQNIVVDGKAYSAALQRPETSINFDSAVAACEAKGPGWHLMTRAEWAAIALWCKMNGTLPRGNNNAGSDHRFPNEKGVAYDGHRTLTGSGPATWAHDHTPEGIFDLNGNVLEWMGGLRFLNGQVQVIPNNDAAHGTDQGPESKEWQPVEANVKPVYYKITGDGISITDKKPGANWDGCRFRDIQSEIEVPMSLRALALFPDRTHETDDRFWIDTEGERLAFAGGGWHYASYAGVFYMNGYHGRSNVSTGVGFRSAFIPTEI